MMWEQRCETLRTEPHSSYPTPEPVIIWRHRAENVFQVKTTPRRLLRDGDRLECFGLLVGVWRLTSLKLYLEDRIYWLGVNDDTYQETIICVNVSDTYQGPGVVKCFARAVGKKFAALFRSAKGCTEVLLRWPQEQTSVISEGYDKRSNLELSISLSLTSPRIMSTPGSLANWLVAVIMSQSGNTVLASQGHENVLPSPSPSSSDLSDEFPEPPNTPRALVETLRRVLGENKSKKGKLTIANFSLLFLTLDSLELLICQ
ncbi:hypothetical protein B0H16DRAFT_1751436 [Mycena metata]|uniref:Uncharacterized protein n=1 Tax=Mycena metata TaxID=1033252 RepID=A0AAD7DL19_9AGAR|nr:hypothetical protein B0H16DRAFT_1751436 [Mycena metata]